MQRILELNHPQVQAVRFFICRFANPLFFLVIPAQAESMLSSCFCDERTWMPVFTGMTNFLFGYRRGILTICE